MTLLVLASEAIGDKTWWNPYLKGALVAVTAIALFSGSIYLLLYTNVGSRLGFLLASAAFTGFLAVLSLFWITGQFPNGPLGSTPSFEVKEIVGSLDDSGFDKVRTIVDEGEEASGETAGQVGTDLDAELTDREGEFFRFADPADYLAVQTFSRGGGRKWPIWWSEKTFYAATEVCPVVEQGVPFGEAPPTPECDTSQPTEWVVTVRDLGTRRLPAWFVFGAASILFGVSLLALHFYELDQREDEEPAEGAATEGEGEPASPVEA